LSLALIVAALAFFRPQAVRGNNAGTYLQYQEPVVTGGASASSTVTYVFYLLLVFAGVILLAYLSSKFIGNRFSRLGAAGCLFHSMPLDHNKRIVFFELNGSILVLGVTEQSISLLKEISEASQVERLKESLPGKGKSGILHDQSGALLELEKKIKPIFRNLTGGKKGDSDK